jgi:2-dehydro-3-deoxygluconokinase
VHAASPRRSTADEFARCWKWVGGGEYSVAYALARSACTGWVGGLNSSPMGAIIRNHARSAGMSVDYVVERKYDGVGKKDRIGLNFTEVGVAKRGSVTLYDRGHTATAGMKPGDVNWKKLFKEDGVRWLHTGGIFAALSEGTRQVVAEAVKAPTKRAIVSYDLNFRSKLWSSKDASPPKPLVLHRCLIGNERTSSRCSATKPRASTSQGRALGRRAVQENGRARREGLPEHQGRARRFAA